MSEQATRWRALTSNGYSGMVWDSLFRYDDLAARAAPLIYGKRENSTDDLGLGWQIWCGMQVFVGAGVNEAAAFQSARDGFATPRPPLPKRPRGRPRKS